MPKWEIGKTYKTVSGLDAKLVYRTNGIRPLVFVITGRNGNQIIAERDEQGRLLKDEIYNLDVVPPEPKKTSTFTNVYNGGFPIVCGNYSTHDDAINFYTKNRVGVLEIKFEDGEYSGAVFHPANKGEDK